MGRDAFEITVNVIKMFAVFLLMVQLVPVLVWAERRVSGFMQNRFGPNRIGPLGLMQLLADAVKFLMKEEFSPKKGNWFLYYAAPVIAIIPGALALASIPLSVPVVWGEYTFLFQGYDMGIGIVFVLGVSSLGGYSLLAAGWGSANKYSLLGALRATAQMVSYELALGLSLVGILMLYGTFSFNEMIAQQIGQPLHFTMMGKEFAGGFLNYLPNWGIFYQPLGAVIFFASTFAETNRLPFDLPEAEGELVAGFHTEYGGFKMLLFFIGEYGHMMVASALLATFYFGGYACPIPWLWNITPEVVNSWWLTKVGPDGASLLTAVVFHVFLLTKILFFLFIFIWVRWTLPRFRYDQLMDLGWKTMLPWALFNTVVTAIWIAVVYR